MKSEKLPKNSEQLMLKWRMLLMKPKIASESMQRSRLAALAPLPGTETTMNTAWVIMADRPAQTRKIYRVDFRCLGEKDPMRDLK